VVSPSPGLTTSQDLLDAVLLRAVGEPGFSEVRFGCRLVGLEQTTDFVTATCADEKTGTVTSVRARYLVAADGARSTVRELVGIPMQGPAALGHTINIHFRADLRDALRGRPVNLAFVLNPAQPGLLLNIDGERSWTAQALYVPAAGQRVEEFTEERCRSIVRTQVGIPDLDVEIVGIAPWVSAARVAERFSEGRVFLVGDAAQEMPPAGGFGMNTGVHEAHGLAWKLAGAIRGWAAPGLLKTYDEERRPLARWITEQALLNLASVGRVQPPDGGPPQTKLGRPEFFRERGMVFGAVYHSSAVISDGSEAPQTVNPVTDYLPTATPGSRAPHLWIELGTERCSTLDLWREGFTLVAAGSSVPWLRDVERVTTTAGVPLRTIACADPAWAEAYGVRPGGAVLVRPDGHVGWRSVASTGANAKEALAALSSILHRSEVTATILQAREV